MNNPMTHTMTSFTGLTLNAHRRASEAPPPCGGRLARYADAPAFSMPQRVAVPSSSSAPSSAGEKREVKECSMLCSSVAALCRLPDHGAGQGVRSARSARRTCQPYSPCPRTDASRWRPACRRTCSPVEGPSIRLGGDRRRVHGYHLLPQPRTGCYTGGPSLTVERLVKG